MGCKSQTLLSYLMQENHQFVEAKPRPPRKALKDFDLSATCSSTTKNDAWPVPFDVRPWDDFKWDTFQNLFNKRLLRALNKRIPDLRNFTYIPPEFLQIYDEDALGNVLVSSNQLIVLEALKKSSTGVVDQNVAMVWGGQAMLIYDTTNKKRPDWAGICAVQKFSDTQIPLNILPGDTKPSWKWSSEHMAQEYKSRPEGPFIYPMTWNWPIRQVLQYCIDSFTRYGYVITDKELVVLRVGTDETAVFPKDKNPIAECRNYIAQRAIVEWHSVPWTNAGTPKNLTINLALWILHLLAANNGRLESKPYGLLKDEALISPDKQQIPPELSFKDMILPPRRKPSLRASKGKEPLTESNATPSIVYTPHEKARHFVRKTATNTPVEDSDPYSTSFQASSPSGSFKRTFGMMDDTSSTPEGRSFSGPSSFPYLRSKSRLSNSQTPEQGSPEPGPMRISPRDSQSPLHNFKTRRTK